MTLKACEELGGNSIVLKDHNFKRFELEDYWTQWGGKMLWHADVITTEIDQFERRLEQHLELNASTVYLWGGASDIWYHQGKQDNIIKAYEMMRKLRCSRRHWSTSTRADRVLRAQRDSNRITTSRRSTTISIGRHIPWRTARFSRCFNLNLPCITNTTTICFATIIKKPLTSCRTSMCPGLPSKCWQPAPFPLRKASNTPLTTELTSFASACLTSKSKKMLG